MKRFFRGYGMYVIVLLICLISVISACSPEKWHRTMVFFFDGVPDSSRTEITMVGDTLAEKDTILKDTTLAKESPSGLLLHPPYKEKACDVCHDAKQVGKLTLVLPDLCYNCHTNFNTKYKYLHGPVASGACIDCHNPHISKQKMLLLRDKQDMCFYCHEKKDVMKNEVHTGIGETNCTECHNPHGGDDRYILK